MVDMTELLVNEIMDAQADNQRNGYRECKLVISVGIINLRIPKLRALMPMENRQLHQFFMAFEPM